MESYVRTRITPELKQEFEAVLRDCGISTSTALRLFVENVVRHEKLPFEISRKPARKERD